VGGKTMKILVIEDNRKVAQALKNGLEGERYGVELAYTGEEGFFLATTQRLDLVVLDLMLPGRSGLEILTALRKKQDRTPVLILTARDAIEDRVIGLDAGADDYLIKPFALPELLARIRALLRRGVSQGVLKLRLADLEMDLVPRAVTRGGRPITLTAREFDLLEFLLRNQGQIVTRRMLAKEVWNETQRVTPLDNVIDVHVARLRKKLDEPFATKLLHTIRGVGFILATRRP
jgi:two-component system copper resistance phosphate regulon response regulator CusR